MATTLQVTLTPERAQAISDLQSACDTIQAINGNLTFVFRSGTNIITITGTGDPATPNTTVISVEMETILTDPAAFNTVMAANSPNVVTEQFDFLEAETGGYSLFLLQPPSTFNTGNVRVFAYRSMSQTLLSVNETILYDTIIADPFSMKTADGQFTVPAAKGGSYLVIAAAVFDSVNNVTGTFRAITILRKRGVDIVPFPAGLAGSVSQLPAAVAEHSVVMDCEPGDIIFAVAAQDATPPIDLLAIDTVMSIFIIRIASA